MREHVKRDKESFPDHFMFCITGKEVEAVVLQKAISSKQHLGGALPYAFAEYGVLMLPNVLKSNTANRSQFTTDRSFVRL